MTGLRRVERFANDAESTEADMARDRIEDLAGRLSREYQSLYLEGMRRTHQVDQIDTDLIQRLLAQSSRPPQLHLAFREPPFALLVGAKIR